MSIREMKVDDLKRIVELEKDLFLSPWNEEDFIHELKENPMAGYYILEKENQIIGYIGLWFLGDQCQITTIATDRHFQGQGCASQLMEYALEKSEELHYQN
ncbi:GNAT family N-acetyltransferase, partial [Faecalibacillus intestinalis]